MFYYNSPIDAYNLVKTQIRKQIIFYYKTNGIMTLKKYMDVDHVMIPKKFEEEIKNLVKHGYLKDNQQKKLNLSSNAIYINLVKKILSKKMMCNKNNSYKTLAFWSSKTTYLFNLW
jgi:hypothetical protein